MGTDRGGSHGSRRRALVPEFPDVPIVGKRFRIVDHTSQAVIVCLCEGAGVPVFLSGPGVVKACPACQTPYAIAQCSKLTVGIVSQAAMAGTS